jgi:hypothetical protein
MSAYLGIPMSAARPRVARERTMRERRMVSCVVWVAVVIG